MQVTGANGDKVPVNATAVVVSLTAVTATTATYLTVYPAGGVPNTSALNVAAANQVTDNQVTAKVGNDGQVAVYNAHGTTNIVVDIMGYYTPVPSGSAGYNPLTPQRIADTRTESGYPDAGQHLTAGGTDVVQVTGTATGVPAGASAAIVDITALNDTPAGYLVAYADGTTVPGTASLTYGNNVVTTKEATVALGADGAFDVTNGQADADITVDLEGYYMAGSGSQYTPAGPTRIADTRTGSGEPYAGQTIGANKTLTVQVTGANGDGVPATATAVVLNVTEVNATTGGYLTVYPAGATQPNTTTVAFPAGSNVGDEVTVKLPASGAVAIYNLQGSTDAVVDVEGYFAAGASQVVASYTYSGDNLRMSKTLNGATQTMLWDTNETVPLLLSDGTSNNYYIYGPGNQPLEEINATNGNITWFQHDRQGSTRILLNNAGTSIGTATYSAYGLATTTGTTSPLGYDGQYTDGETGLIYLQARYYEPTTAQFLSRDRECLNNGVTGSAHFE
ncbi:MAG: RHS repeat-associated core domain-containing protein [Acidimicrobiales bacterium]